MQRRIPDNKFRPDNDRIRSARRIVPGKLLKQTAGRLLPDLLPGIVDRRQLRLNDARDDVIIKTDNGDILGNPYPILLKCLQEYRSEKIVAVDGSIAPLAFPDEPIALSEILAP